MIDEARTYRLIASDIVKDEYVTAEDFNSTFLAYNEVEKCEIACFLFKKGIKIDRSHSLKQEVSPQIMQKNEIVFAMKNKQTQIKCPKMKKRKRHKVQFEKIIPQETADKLGRKKSGTLTNAQLLVLILRGDAEAESDILIKNQNLVIREATKYTQLFGNGLELEDLIQAGYLGLLNVVRIKQVNSKTNCLQLFIRHIRKSILAEIASGGFFISFPIEIIERIERELKVNKENSQFGQVELRDFSHIREKLEQKVTDSEETLSLWKTVSNSISMNTLVNLKYETEMQDILYSRFHYMEDEVINSMLLTKIIKITFAELSPKNKMIVGLRMGFIDEEPQSIEQIASHLHLTRQRVQQIVSKSILKARSTIVLMQRF